MNSDKLSSTIRTPRCLTITRLNYLDERQVVLYQKDEIFFVG